MNVNYSYQKSYYAQLKKDNAYFYFWFQKVFIDWMEDLLERIKKEWIRMLIFLMYLTIGISLSYSIIFVVVRSSKWAVVLQLLLIFIALIFYHQFSMSQNSNRKTIKICMSSWVIYLLFIKIRAVIYWNPLWFY